MFLQSRIGENYGSYGIARKSHDLQLHLQKSHFLAIEYLKANI